MLMTELLRKVTPQPTAEKPQRGSENWKLHDMSENFKVMITGIRYSCESPNP